MSVFLCPGVFPRTSLVRRIIGTGPKFLTESGAGPGNACCHSDKRLRRRELETTMTEEKLMAATAITGDNLKPNNG